MISVLRPAPPISVASVGIVASPNAEALIVSGSGGVAVELMPEAAALASMAPDVGLHAPDVTEMPNAEMTGGDAVETGEGIADAPVMVVARVVAAALVLTMLGHTVIAPSATPGTGPKLPRLY